MDIFRRRLYHESMEQQQKTIITLFEENELNIGKLYKLYSQKFPDRQAFWLGLSMEEAGHAADIRASHRKNDDLFETNKFTAGVLKYVMDFVEEKIQEVQKKEISHIDALNNALRIEQSILEKKCFELFTPTSQQLKAVLASLNKETEAHVNRLRKELKRQK
jgi:hypothetical protein